MPGASNYDVSSLGRVRSWRTCGGGWRRRSDQPRLLTIALTRAGYPSVEICMDDGERTKPKLTRIHCLVSSAWHGPRPDGLVTTHLDGNKLNNRPSNLAYRTQAENIADKKAHGTEQKGEAHPLAMLTEDDVRAIRASDLSQTELGQLYGVTQSTIWTIVHRKTWRHVA